MILVYFHNKTHLSYGKYLFLVGLGLLLITMKTDRSEKLLYILPLILNLEEEPETSFTSKVDVKKVLTVAQKGDLKKVFRYLQSLETKHHGDGSEEDPISITVLQTWLIEASMEVEEGDIYHTSTQLHLGDNPDITWFLKQLNEVISDPLLSLMGTGLKYDEAVKLLNVVEK